MISRLNHPFRSAHQAERCLDRTRRLVAEAGQRHFPALATEATLLDGATS